MSPSEKLVIAPDREVIIEGTKRISSEAITWFEQKLCKKGTNSIRCSLRQSVIRPPVQMTKKRDLVWDLAKNMHLILPLVFR